MTINPNSIIHHGDCLEKLKELESDSIDCIVTDPPYGYSFMNKDWDKAVVSVDVWKECLRVLKSGAFAFIMSSPRQDILARQIINLQDAGFKTNFTSLYHSFASGFPKAANTTKLLEKRGIKKPELEGSYLGLQPKPALEVILCVQKPIEEKSFVDQALKNQKGITWLDDCRIPFQNENDLKSAEYGSKNGIHSIQKTNFEHGYRNNIKTVEKADMFIQDPPNEKGRFPANLLVSDDSLNDGKRWRGAIDNHTATSIFGNEMKDKKKGWSKEEFGSYSRYFDLDKWYSSQQAQFIITPKASSSERQGSTHPTMKPIRLMSFLITMGSRPQDIILDPFMGSGTTGIAALQLGRKFIGIEKELEYVEIAQKRIEPYLRQEKILNYLQSSSSNKMIITDEL